ncbi:MAG: HAD family hydrolase [Chloroflexi bacterium]|jgi:phosphoglycolate phosphatase|nr:HAD family hydrolase [Chloroflexota bacterium]
MLEIAGKRLDPRLVVFDKDGTLIAFDRLWHTWFARFMGALQAETPLDAETLQAIADTLGYAPDTDVWDPLGPLTLATTREIVLLVAGQVYRHQPDRGWDDALARAEKAEISARAHLDLDELVEPVGDVRGTLERLQKAGITLAVVTTDNRTPTEHTLSRLGLLPFFAALVCGDDGLPNKPAPDMALEACRQVGIAPAQAAMIGDTIADMHMAHQAGFGWAIGVTSGALSGEVLAEHADLVIPDINAIQIVEPEENERR